MNATTGSKAAILLLSMLATAPAVAANCDKAISQADINTCFGKDFATADKTLNTLYQQLMKKLEPEDQKLLQNAQRSWISFRDKHCAFVSNTVSGGSIYPTIFSGCATKVTVQRSQQLRARLYCQDGDMGCGS